MTEWRVVEKPEELTDAVKDGVKLIEVNGTITGAPMITLPPGGKLRGGTLVFRAKGVWRAPGKRDRLVLESCCP